jgi:aryl carrier-like protein
LLEFVGRVDTQVKIRGFRVEPGEVEAALRAHPSVADARVVARAEGGEAKRLVAYAVLRAAEPDASAALRTHLRERLPEYMVPAAVVVLDALPLTPNGKVDDRALPAPAAVRAAVPEAEREPRDETERALAEVLRSVLALRVVGIHDNFFELGGDSILCLKVVSRARDAGVPLTTRDVFHLQTVAAMAAEVRGREPAWAPESAAAEAELDDGDLDELLYALGVEGEPA